MGYKVLVTACAFIDTGDPQRKRMEAAGLQVRYVDTDWPLTEEELLQVLPGVHAVIAGSDRYSRRVLSQADSLRVLSRWGVGYDSVDLAAATEQGIIVTNTPGHLSEPVADLTFGFILALARDLPRLNSRMHAGVFQRRNPAAVDVWRKTLGIIGLGGIGKAVARRATGFQMEILAHDVRRDETAVAEFGVAYVSLEELLARSDFVTLHCELTSETRGLIGEARLRQMKPEAFLVNAARGAIVDEAALVRALREGWIAGVALDVFQAEPLPSDHPLLSLENCVLTPHAASLTRETMSRINEVVTESVMDVLEGRLPRGALNPGAVTEHR